MAPRHVLISGASVAGPALAFWLDRYGITSTIVERAPSLRTGGQNVDVRGAGREVLRRARLEADVLALNTTEVGTRFLGPDGRVAAEFPAGRGDTDGATAEVEILRGDLARLLVDRTQGDEGATSYVYGRSITAVDDRRDGVTATLDDGSEQSADLLVAADGIGSSTRDLVLGDSPSIRSLGMDMTYLTIPRTSDDTDWWNWFSAPAGLALTLRPDPYGTTRAVFSSITKDRATIPAPDRSGAQRRSTTEQRDHLHRQFEGIGWQVPRALAALDAALEDGGADAVYYESIGQVLAPGWSAGRVAVLGDAAWCASPVSGMGTTLALVGAYVLAGEIAAHTHHADAFAAYERVMRPYVTQAQNLPPGTPRAANPQTRVGIGAFHAVLRVAASPVGAILGRAFRPPAEQIDLPDYSHLER